MKALSTRHRIAGTLGVLALAVAACGNSSSTSSGGGGPSSAASPSSTSSAHRDMGGTLNVATWQEPSSFLGNQWVDSMSSAVAVLGLAGEGLLGLRSVDDTSNAKTLADFYTPQLATEVPTTANGDVKTSGCPNSAAKMCVTWKLRSGVMWHDGTTFSSHDVCSTVALEWTKYGPSGAKNPTAIQSVVGWNKILDCKEETPTQATLDFSAIYSPYLALLTGSYSVLPAKLVDVALNANSDLEKTNQTVDLTVGSGNTQGFKGTDTLDNFIDGTGPFVFSSYTKTKQAVFVKNNNYWNKDNEPALDKIVVVFKADAQSILTAAQAGEVDFGMDYRLALLPSVNNLVSSGKVTLETIPDSGAERVAFNLCAGNGGLCGTGAKIDKWTADPAFRRAVGEAINRPSILQNIALNKTVIPADSFLYLGAEYIKTDQDPTLQFSVDKAKADLDAAGYKVSASCPNGGRADSSGTCITLALATTAGNTARARQQTQIQQDLANVGIPVTTPQIKSGTFFGQFSNGASVYAHKYDMSMYTNNLASPAEPDSLYTEYHGNCGGSCASKSQIPNESNGGQGQNDTGYSNAQVDKDFDDGENTLDLTQRASIYKDAELQLAKDLPELPLYQQVTVNSYSTKLKGVSRNDIQWLLNPGAWWCTGGVCQA
ncbi:MAG TPA: ABC transporter substrate-binding protein [Candidatus Dormibacteraeota bacterium]|nr:ABC transporter substrate-binding protein [Candidatus Dormibacteraeota bacterium]